MSDWLEAEQHADRAQEMFERGRWAEAEAELRKALALNPDQAEWHYNLGLTLEAAGRDSDALSAFERAAELLPDQVEPSLSAGIVANRLGQFRRGVEFFQRAIQMDVHCQPAYANMMDAHLRLGELDDVETTFYLGQQAFEEPSSHCLSVMGDCMVQRDQLQRAEWCYREAIRIDPGFPRLRARLANVLAMTNRRQQALRMYLRDLRDDPGNVDTLLDYGELLMELGRLPEAGEKFRRVLEMEPANVDAHYRLGEIALEIANDEQAHLEFELVMKLDPGYPQVRLSLAEALLNRGRKQAALLHLNAELEQIETEDRAGTEAHDRRPKSDLSVAGQTESRDGEDRESTRGLNAPLGLVDRYRLASLLLDAGAADKAVRLFEQVIDDEGESVELLRKLALARFQSNDRNGGVAASRRVIRLDPNSVPAYHNLALAALEDGQLRVAAGWITRGLGVDRFDDGLRRLRSRLVMLAAGWLFRRVFIRSRKRARKQRLFPLR